MRTLKQLAFLSRRREVMKEAAFSDTGSRRNGLNCYCRDAAFNGELFGFIHEAASNGLWVFDAFMCFWHLNVRRYQTASS